MSATTGDSGSRLAVGFTQLVTASILVHMDGRPRFVQYSPAEGMWSITDGVRDERRPAYEVTQQEVIVHLPKVSGGAR